MSVLLTEAQASLAAELLDAEISRGGPAAQAKYRTLMLALATTPRGLPEPAPAPVAPVAAPEVAAAPATFPQPTVEVAVGEAVSPHASAPPHASPTV